MNEREARQVLGVDEYAEWTEIKKNYRKLMMKYHPDMDGRSGNKNSQAQRINEAFAFLKKLGLERDFIKKEDVWNEEINEQAFSKRNVYIYYSLTADEEAMYYQIAKGKYLWNPQKEDFSLFLKSIYHLTEDLLEKTIQKDMLQSEDYYLSKEDKFFYQTALFEYVVFQYINPYKILTILYKPKEIDVHGREIYEFRAYLTARGNQIEFGRIAALKKKERIIPASFRRNKILVVNQRQEFLGHLSLEDDRIYFAIVPLLKAQHAQIKIEVCKLEVRKKVRPFVGSAELSVQIRLDKGAKTYQRKDENMKIAEILGEYEKFVKQRR